MEEHHAKERENRQYGIPVDLHANELPLPLSSSVAWLPSYPIKKAPPFQREEPPRFLRRLNTPYLLMWINWLLALPFRTT
jgi:hypothetical protein